MPRYSYDRLSAQDYSFLVAERPNVLMHVAGTQIFRAGPLRTEEGGIDIDSIKRAIESVIHLIPRYRQRLKWIPLENHPVWIDDRQFNLDYHIRHTALPRPGREEQLKRLSSRIMAQPLDRARPLWEMWVVEGLDRDRFAVITKIHHCMIDGLAGADLTQVLLSPFPNSEPAEVAAYIPRPAPTSSELLRDAWLHRATTPVRLARELSQFGEGRETADVLAELQLRARALGELVGWAVKPASDTPLNGRIGPHRRFDWLSQPLARVKAVSKALECSVNDVVITTVTGAVRDFMLRRRVRPEEIDFRVSAPVSVRRPEERGQMGNRVSSWILKLPIDQMDPLARLESIRAVTRQLKESKHALGVEMIMRMAEFTPSVLLSLGVRAASGPINMIVTNIPGPQIPLYLLGAELEALYPMVPLLPTTGLGIALFSFNGRLCWGFNADYEIVPDLRSFAKSIASAFEELAAAARIPTQEEHAAPAPLALDEHGEAVRERPSKGRSRSAAAGRGQAQRSGTLN